jgi:hypothetical protein
MRETQFRWELEAVTWKPRPTLRFFRETEGCECRRWVWVEEIEYAVSDSRKEVEQ